MEGFKGTKTEWHLVEYAGYFNLQSGMYYGDKNILDRESIGSDIAEANAKLARAAPDLLRALIEVKEVMETEGFDIGETAKQAIEKALK